MAAESHIHYNTRVTQLLSAPRPYEATLQEVADLLVPGRADWAILDLLFAGDGESFERVAVACHRPGHADIARALRRTYPLTGHSGRGVEAAIRELRTQAMDTDDELLRSVARDEVHLAALRAMELRSTITSPLIARGQAIGALTIGACDRSFDQEDARFAEQFALAAAAVIENARLFRDKQRGRDRLERMQTVMAALSTARTAAEVTEVACRIGAEAMDAYSGALWMLQDDGSLELAGTWGTTTSFIEQFRTLPRDSDAPAQCALRSGEPIWVESEADYQALSPDLYARAKAHNRIAAFGVVPIRGGRQAFGAITFAHRCPHSYDAEDRAFYVVLTQHCAAALERAMLFDEIQRSAAHFQLAIEAAPTAMIMVDRAGRIVLANSQVQHVFGYAPGELVGQPLAVLIPSHLRDRHPGFRESFFVDPRARPMGAGRDLRGVHKNGTEVTVEIGLTPIDTADGKLVIASIIDITERVAQGRRIELLQSMTSALSRASSASEVVTAIVEEGTACFGSPHGAVWLVSKDQLALELSCWRGYHGIPVDRFERFALDRPVPVTVAFRTRTSLWYESRAQYAAHFPEFEATSRGLAGAEIAFFAVPLLVKDRCLGVMSFNWTERRSFDGSDRTFAEALALHAAQALERAYLYDEAEEGRRHLLEAGRLKDEFLAVVSHELRTPLSAVLGWASMLRTNPETNVTRAIETIERNARAQLRLVEDMLDASRIITGKLAIEPRRIDVAKVLRGALGVVGPMAGAKQVRLVTEIADGPCWLYGDADRLQQVFWNVLSNAIKFTPKQGRVMVRMTRADGAIEVRVTDTGCGIRPDFLPLVFDRFRQADASKTRSHAGLGLGLAIAKHIVELHDGAITAESAGAGQGSTFTMSLPVRAIAADDPPVRRHSSAAGGPARPLDGVNIVVCDDDADSLELLDVVLSQAGATVSLSSTAAEAARQVQELQPQVLLSDIGLPIMDGYSLLREIRALPTESGGGTPAIALTAYASREDVRRAIDAGYVLHLAKPIDPAELVTAVANIAGRIQLR